MHGRWKTAFLTFVVILAAFAGSILNASEAKDEAGLIESLRKGIQQSERALLNLTVDGRLLCERWNPETRTWDYAGEKTVTGWYIGMPGSKARIDFHKEIFRVYHRAEPFLVKKYSLAYNGHIGQQYLESEGGVTQQVWNRGGRIDADRPEILSYEYSTGWICSLYGATDEWRKRMSEVLSADAAASGKLTAKRTNYSGVASIQADLRAGESTTYTWVFDPARDYAILGHERRANLARYRNWTAEKFENPAPRVWYPSVVRVQFFGPGEVPTERVKFEASKIVVNDSQFSEDIFTLKWPPGSRVTDMITHRYYEVAGPSEEIARRIGAQVAEVRSQAGSDAIQAQVPTGVKTPERARGARNSPSHSRIWLIAAGIVGVAVLAVGAYTALHHKK